MQQAIENTLTRGPGGEVHADMSESARHRCSTGVNLGGAADPCDQDQTEGGPIRLQSLTGGHESDSPTDDNRRAEIVNLAGLKIDIRKSVEWACAHTERRIGSRQKDLPTTPQIEARHKVSPSQKK